SVLDNACYVSPVIVRSPAISASICSPSLLLSSSLYHSPPPLDLPSFPTRRSSDLWSSCSSCRSGRRSISSSASPPPDPPTGCCSQSTWSSSSPASGSPLRPSSRCVEPIGSQQKSPTRTRSWQRRERTSDISMPGTIAEQITRRLRALPEKWAAFREGLLEFYVGPYRQTLKREQQAEDDFFSVVVLGEALGVPDPAAYYTAELMPALWDDFHAWHRRMGLPRSPLDHIACC